jgi:hypothetical protein
MYVLALQEWGPDEFFPRFLEPRELTRPSSLMGAAGGPFGDDD